VTQGRRRDVGERNEELVEHLLRFDAVLIAGQAKSHCVAWTIDDLLDEPTLAEKVFLLEGLLVAGRRAGRRRLYGRGERRIRSLCRGGHARRALDRPARELAGT
jgi:hypothetical protein